MLERAREKLMRGEVARGFHCLEKAWQGELPQTSKDLIGFTRACLDLAGNYEWFAAGEVWLNSAEEALKAATCLDGERKFAFFLLSALRARLHYQDADYRAGVDFFKNISPGRLSEEFPPLKSWEPWLINFYCTILIAEQRLDEFDRLIRNPPVANWNYSPYDATLRLRLLGHRYLREHIYEKAFTVLNAAVKKFQRLGGLEGEIQKLMCYLLLAKVHSVSCRHLEARRLLGLVEKEATRLRQARLLHNFRNYKAFALKREGLPREGLETVLKNASFNFQKEVGGSKSYKIESACRTLLVTARLAGFAGRFTLAKNLIHKVEAHRGHFKKYQNRVYFHLVKGEWLRWQNTAASRAQAREELALAENILHQNCPHDKTYMTGILLNRGWIAYHEKNVQEAVWCSIECLDRAREKLFLQIQTDNLFLQSLLLLEEDAPKPMLYDRILPRLGAIQNPETLFRIIANLYIYSWELEDQIELTDLHLKQLNRLREHLSSERFEHLYDTLVSGPIFERMRRKLFG